MRWLDSITDAMDMKLGKFQVVVRDREAWRASVHGVTQSCLMAPALPSCPLAGTWALTLMWSLTKEALPLGQPGRRPPAPQPQPSSSLLKSEPWLSTREWLRPHHRAMGRWR